MPAYRTKGSPFTYIIEYGDHLNQTAEAVKRIRAAPPSLFHGGQDLTYTPRAGASDFRRRKRDFTKKNPAPWSFPLSPEQAKERVQATRRWTHELHEAGVDTVIPYICNQTIAGDPEKRLGLWWFYDNWEQYADDVGPKPAVDPIQWMQREPDGRLHFNYPYRFVKTDPPLRFAPCPNNPHWHDWLKRVVRMIARDGFDGVFVDNNIVHCRCEYCEREFRRYLSETYSPAQLRRRFGTSDVTELGVATTGDVVLWACSQGAYAEWLQATDPEEFREKFGTDDASKAIMSEAGNGFHWGRADQFWAKTLRETRPPEEVERILREGDLASRGVDSPKARSLWADTQKFWAWTVGQRNADLRDAAEEVRPGFIIVPNWGDMSGLHHTISRSLEGKNVRLWAPGADIVFFEEEYFPGTVAPGYTFDLMIDYKYAAACGLRSCVLPYRGADRRALAELAMAEAAAWGGDGAFVQPGYGFPEVRTAYRAFFDRYGEWYTNRTSYASVGLVYSFDELHMGNSLHLREVYALSRYLADHHILFDFLCEGQITLRELSRFDAVIVPHVEFLPSSARRAIHEYLQAGGSLLITGNTGAFDDHGRAVRKRDAFTCLRQAIWGGRPGAYAEHSGNGHLLWLNDVFSWLPKRSRQMVDLADLHEEELGGLYAEIAHAASQEPTDDPRLREALERLAGGQLAVLGSKAPPTLRVSAWARNRRSPSVVLHLVNYNAPGPGTPSEGEVIPVENVEVKLWLPEGMRVRSVTSANPWKPDGEELSFSQRPDGVRFLVPRVDAYEAVRVG